MYNYTPLDVPIIAHIKIEIPQENNGVPSWRNIINPPRDSKKAWILYVSALRPKQQQESYPQPEGTWKRHLRLPEYTPHGGRARELK